MENEKILIDDSFLTSLLADIETAKNTIDMETYIFNDDNVGTEVANALCAAAQRGVKIKVLVDGIGSPNWGSAMTIKLEQCGVLTKVYHPLPWALSHWHHDEHHPHSFLSKFIRLFSKINSRNHRKVCIIDGRIIYISSANITDHLLKNANTWRETGVRMNGNPEDLLTSMEIAWQKSKPKDITHKANINNTVEASPFLLNYNWRLRRKYYRNLLNQLNNAKLRIWVTNSYFVPDNRLLKALVKASQRGVDVKIILPKIADVYIESLAAKVFYEMLLKNGVEIFEYTATIMHAKSLIIDDWYLVGTSNLNYRSLRHDLEVDAIIQTSGAKATLETYFNIDLRHSLKINLADVHSQPFKQLLGRIILIFKYWI